MAHLPSDVECHKAFVAPMPQDTDLLPRRTKCLELIMKVRLTVERGVGVVWAEFVLELIMH